MLKKSCAIVNKCRFPKTTNTNINMMPFILGDKTSLPDHIHTSWKMISDCNIAEKHLGKVCYLTIDESLVKKGKTQRRQGVHIELPGALDGGWGGGGWGGGGWRSPQGFPRQRKDGIYMASNVNNSCKVWNTQISHENIGNLGEVRSDNLGEGTNMNANDIWWMTDKTPHQALPQTKTQMRQFFRLVTSNVSHWYSKHSTANPLGIMPDQSTIILNHNKFKNKQ